MVAELAISTASLFLILVVYFIYKQSKVE